MPKRFYGFVGYAVQKETSPDVHEDEIIEFPYYGDIISNRFRRGQGSDVNDDFSLNVTISILADEYAYMHYSKIKYVVYGSEKWLVTGVEPSRPRLILSIGGLYDAGRISN